MDIPGVPLSRELLLIIAYAVVVLAFVLGESHLAPWLWFAVAGAIVAAPLVLVGLLLSRGHR